MISSLVRNVYLALAKFRLKGLAVEWAWLWLIVFKKKHLIIPQLNVRG
jgi:hypothetical protein